MAKKKKEPDKLALDAAAALAARMSYGKWKAMHSAPATIGKNIPEGWLVCQWCGKPFKPTTKRPQKYCEAGCQRQASNERYRKRYAERTEPK